MTELTTLLKDLPLAQPQAGCEIAALALDTRQVVPGSLFFALAGSRSHGRAYLAQAIHAGAVAVLIELDDAGLLNAEECELLASAQVYWACAPSLRQWVGWISERFYGLPAQAMTMIGITGTNGKTSCSQFIAQAWQQMSPCGVIGTLGNGLIGSMTTATHTTPDAITLHRELARIRAEGATAVAMEVSSHGLDQGRVAGVAFDTAVFTNLTRDHLDYHGSMENYGAAKRKLFQMPGLRHAVVNVDDAFGLDLLATLAPGVERVGYGLGPQAKAKGAQLVGDELSLSDAGLAMTVHYREQQARVQSRLLGRFNASNLLAALAVLLAHGVELTQAVNYIAACRPVPGRMETLGGGSQPLVVVDYAHTPDALEQVLQALREHTAGQLGCVFGCGGNRDAGKRPLMGEMAVRLADWVMITDDNPRHEDGAVIIDQILQGVGENTAVSVQRDRASAIAAAIARAGAGDVVLVAGKGHEDYQIIGNDYLPFSDSEQVRNNLNRQLHA